MISRGKIEKRAARTARLSAALRENLRRRKAQARGRAEQPEGNEAPPAGNSAEAPTPDFRRNQRSD